MASCLVVEDHGDTREGYVEFLAFAGYSVRGASGRAEMQERLAEQLPDAIVMDLQLPGTDGWTLIQELRSAPETRQIPVVVVSAAVRETDREAAERAGCDAFVPKPCDPSTIVAELARLIDLRRRGEQDV